MKYNYLESIKNDILEYIKENYTTIEQLEKLEDRQEWEESLQDTFWYCDSVTGNASGSYTFSRYKAKEYVIENLETLKDAISDYGLDSNKIVEKFINEDWEYFDVTIRCYLLSAAITVALDELESWYNKILPKVEE